MATAATTTEDSILDSVRDLFSGHPERLARGAYARDEGGEVCPVLDTRARSWCLLGAVEKTAYERCPRDWGAAYDGVHEILQDVLRDRGLATDVADFSDQATLEQVLEIVASARG